MRKLPDRMWKLPRHEDDEAAEDEGIGRILALSDGVFAIAITLLIITIAIPATTSDAGLPKALLALWPRYLAYVLSFLVIARFWVTHHLAFRLIARYDATLVWLNLLLLMFVSFRSTSSGARPNCWRAGWRCCAASPAAGCSAWSRSPRACGWTPRTP
jgi:Endosomal/lysosomal potassium channel TMEM175